MQKYDNAGQVCNSRVLLGKSAEAGCCWASVLKQDIEGMCVEAGYC